MKKDEHKEIRSCYDRYYKKMQLEHPSVMSARLGLQMLQVIISRIANGRPFDDFVDGKGPWLKVMVVRQAHENYKTNMSRPEKEPILKSLEDLSERWVQYFVKSGFFVNPALAEKIIRDTQISNPRAAV